MQPIMSRKHNIADFDSSLPIAVIVFFVISYIRGLVFRYLCNTFT